jgi:dolichol kinase
MRTLFEIGTAVGSLTWSFGPSGTVEGTTAGCVIALTLLSLWPTVDRIARAGMGVERAETAA